MASFDLILFDFILFLMMGNLASFREEPIMG
jgi:hypothetical protein